MPIDFGARAHAAGMGVSPSPQMPGNDAFPAFDCLEMIIYLTLIRLGTLTNTHRLSDVFTKANASSSSPSVWVVCRVNMRFRFARGLHCSRIEREN